jgi:hypothetical protein
MRVGARTSLNLNYPMESLPSRLDHLVIDVRDRMDEAERLYSSLGFHLTERSRHTIGSMNCLIVFGTHYLELLGFDPQSPQVRADISQFPVGLNGLVFAADDADSLSHALAARGVAAEPPATFSRQVRFQDGTRDARFRVVRLQPGQSTYGRVYFCQHLTPELIWRREWQQHPNGAFAISRVTIAAHHPENSFSMMQTISGGVRHEHANRWVLPAGEINIEFTTQEELARLLREVEAAPDSAGRADYMALLTIRTRSLSQTTELFRRNGIKTVPAESGVIRVPASEAMNVTLDFTE